MEENKWKPVLGLEDRFEVTTNGDVKSLKWNRSKREKILHLKPRKEDGYIRVQWREGKYYFKKYLHILIYETFVGPIPEGYDIHHKNHNPSDNRLENLELLSRTDHAIMHNKDKIGMKYKRK